MPHVKLPAQNPFWNIYKSATKPKKDIPEEKQLVPSEQHDDFMKRIQQAADLIMEQIIGTPEGAIQNLVAPMQVSNLFHGSPYKFKKFINEAVGTGEGAQSFGWGHYLTESPEIAKGYARHQPPVIKFPKEMLEAIKAEDNLGYDTAKQAAMDLYIHDDFATRWELSPQLRAMVEDFKNKVKTPQVDPSIYETTVNKGKPSSADVFLEWDKPVEGEIQKFFTSNPQTKNYFDDAHVVVNRGLKSEHRLSQGEAYQLMERAIGEKEASQILSNLGFTGIKYPSGTLSGIKDSPYYNYVIFNPDDITIEAVKRLQDK